MLLPAYRLPQGLRSMVLINTGDIFGSNTVAARNFTIATKFSLPANGARAAFSNQQGERTGNSLNLHGWSSSPTLGLGHGYISGTMVMAVGWSKMLNNTYIKWSFTLFIS